MRNIIEDIISKVSIGLAFDAHFVIDTIIREHSDDYLLFAERHSANSRRAEYVHSELAKIIASFEGSLIERLDDRSWSYNIRGNASPCTLWRRVV
jgi:hypothetical protein